MATLTTVYNILFNDHFKLVLADIEDVKNLVKEDEDILHKLLLNEVKVIPTNVTTDSKMYQTAIFNSNVVIKK